jgi:hypothetical protein
VAWVVGSGVGGSVVVHVALDAGGKLDLRLADGDAALAQGVLRLRFDAAGAPQTDGGRGPWLLRQLRRLDQGAGAWNAVAIIEPSPLRGPGQVARLRAIGGDDDGGMPWWFLPAWRPLRPATESAPR